MSLLGRCGALVLVAALMISAGVVRPALAAVGSGSDDVFTFLGNGGYVLGYASAKYAPPFVVSPGRYDGDREFIDVYGDPQLHGAVNLRIEMPRRVGERFRTGRYSTERGATEQHAQLSIGADHRGCGWGPGVLDVLEVSRDADGELTGIALDYSAGCDQEAAPMHGSLRWNSGVPYRHTAATPFHARTPPTAATVRGSVVLTNSGTAPQTYAAATWQPDTSLLEEQATVTVTSDGCAGVTLQPGSSCSVDVSIASDGIQGVAGHVRTPDGTSRGAAYALVTMPPLPGLEDTLRATPVRGGVRLSAFGDKRPYRVLRAVGRGPEQEVAKGVTMPWTDTAVTAGELSSYRVAALFGGAETRPTETVTTGPLPVPAGSSGTLTAVGPVRVLDTRDGTGARPGPVRAGETVRLDLHASGRVPVDGAVAVLLNVTGTDATTPTHVGVWPAGEPRPATSSLNLVPGRTRANQVVVPVGADGQVELRNNAGSTHLVVDLQGYFATADGPHGGGYHPLHPERVLDTRAGDDAVGPGEEMWIPLPLADVAPSGTAAVAVNLTVTEPTTDGHLTAWSGQGRPPLTSNVNFAPGQTVANHAVLPVGVDPAGRPGIAVRNSAGSTHVVVDVTGWFDTGTDPRGLRYAPTPATRVVDTRTRPGRAPHRRHEHLLIGQGDLPPAAAHVVNVTATEATGAGHLLAWSGDILLPETSTLNVVPGEDAANLAIVRVFGDSDITVSGGPDAVHVVVDHVGIFY